MIYATEGSGRDVDPTGTEKEPLVSGHRVRELPADAGLLSGGAAELSGGRGDLRLLRPGWQRRRRGGAGGGIPDPHR